MKQTLLSIIFVLIGYLVSAQVSLSLNPDMVMVDVDPMQFETVAHSWVRNDSDEAVTIKWFRHVEEISAMWESAICDLNACWSVQIDSTPDEQLIVLEPGDSSNLDVHIRPSGVDGSAKISVTVVDVDNPENLVEGTYSFNETTTSTTDPIDVSINLYPNPTDDFFQLTNYDEVASVVIFNVVGSRVKEFNAYQGQKFDISFLNKGMYLVRLVDQRKDVIKTLRLNKR